MFSKLFILLPLLIAALFSCSSEDVEPSSSIKFDAKRVACVKTADETFNKYLEGQLNNQEISEFWVCTDEVVDLIHDLLDGSENKNVIPVGELYVAIRDVISDKVTREQIESFVKLKPLLVGGAKDVITKAELRELRSVIKELDAITQYFKTAAHVLYKQFSGVAVANVEEQALVNKALNEIFADITDLFNKNSQSLDFDDIKDILNTFNVEKADELAEFAKKTKQLLVTDEDLVLGSEWEKLFLQSKRIVKLLFKATLDPATREGKNFSKFINTVYEDITTILHDGMISQPNSAYNVAVIADYIYSLSSIGLLDDESLFSADFVSGVWNGLNEFIFPHENKQEFTREDVAFLSDILAEWTSGEEWIYSEGRIEHARQIKNKTAKCNFRLAANDHVMQLKSVDACADFRIRKTTESEFPYKGFLDLTVNADKSLLPEKDFSEINIYMTLVKLVIKSYTESDPSGVPVLRIEELEAFFNDFKPVMVKIGIVTEEDQGFHQRLFQEADIFLPSSNGKGDLNLIEFTQYLRYAFSAIAQGRGFLNDYLLEDKKCQETTKEDGTKVMSKSCFMLEFKNNYEEYLSNMPKLVTYLKDLEKEDADNSLTGEDSKFNNFIVNIASTMNLIISEEEISTAKLIPFFGLFNYVESVIKRFDANVNGSVNHAEAIDAYHAVFKPIVKQLVDKFIRNAEDDLAKIIENENPDQGSDTEAEKPENCGKQVAKQVFLAPLFRGKTPECVGEFIDRTTKKGSLFIAQNKQNFNERVFAFLLKYGTLPVGVPSNDKDEEISPTVFAAFILDPRTPVYESKRLQLSKIFKLIADATRAGAFQSPQK